MGISFPTISPAQMVPDDNSGAQLSQILLSIAQGRQKIALEREQLENQKKETESQVAHRGQLDAESKARIKTEADKQDQAIAARTAADIAAKHLMDAVVRTNGKLTDEVLNEVRVAAFAEGDKQLKKHGGGKLALDALEALRKAQTDTSKGAADATRAGAEATKSVAEAPTAGRQARATARSTETQAAQNVAQTQAAMLQSWKLTGRPMGEIRKEFGMARPPEGIPDDAVWTDPNAGGTGGGATREQAARAAVLGGQMRYAHTILNAMKDKQLTFLAGIKRGLRAGGLSALANKALSPEQRVLVHAITAYAESRRFYISGQQSAETEALRMMNTAVEEYGDDRETKRIKSLLRQIELTAIEEIATGTISPVDAAQRLVTEAIALDAPPQIVRGFRDVLADAKKRADGNEKRVRAPGNSTSLERNRAENALERNGIRISTP